MEFETKAVHAGFNKDKVTGATALPIHTSASFAYDSAQDLADVFAGRKYGYIYSRIANPTVSAVEKRINSLEDGVGAILTSSGMSAIATVVFTLTRQGDEIVSSRSLFGGTLLFFKDVIEKYGVKVKYVDAKDVDAYRTGINDKTKLVFLETLGNPKLDIPDIERIGGICRENNVPLVVDGTLTTPYLFDAKKFGVSIIIHSTTKYITGNGTAIGGVLVDLGNYDWAGSKVPDIRELSKRARQAAFLVAARNQIASNIGVSPSPFNAYLINLGIETLALRMKEHCNNALELALWLKSHSQVKEVNYPGLEDHADHETVNKQFDGRASGLLTLRLGSKAECFNLIDKLNMVKNLANLGDAKTLILHPGSTIYHECSDEEKEGAGVTDDLLRVSVGIENIKDIIADFEQAFRT